MANVDASAGADRYARKRTNRPGMCLWEVQVNGYQCPQSIGPNAGRYPTAYSGWLADKEKITKGVPPKGAPVYFGPSPTRTDRNKNAGDVCISLGNGLLRCSDGGGGGVMATMTIAARAKQIQRPYLGYQLPIFLGHTLVNLGTVGDVVTGWIGAAYVVKLREQLQITGSGAFLDDDMKVLQKFVGTGTDGMWGPLTCKALQKLIGAKADGVVGPETISKWKAAIDAGKFDTRPKPTPVQRQVKPNARANLRTAPTPKAPQQGEIAANAIVTPLGWERGETVAGNPVWFKIDAKRWAWSGGFTDTGTHDLADLTPAPVEPPVVPPVEPPVDPPIEPPVEPTEPPNAKPAVNKWAALIVGIVGLGALIAGIVSGFFQ